MRARSLKPGLFLNETLGTADPLYSLIFEGLWCMADREGRLEDRPLRIHAGINPYRPGASTVQALDWLVQERFVIRYSIDGVGYLAVVNFRGHQQPHIKEAPSRIPPPPSSINNQQVAQASDKHRASTVPVPEIPALAALNPSSLTPDSGLLNPCESRIALASDKHGASTVLEVTRGTGIIPAGNRLTALSAAAAFDSLLEDWRRDVPEANADLFSKWIVHVEESGKQMTPSMRLGQARRLASNGDMQAQADVVNFCIEQGYKSLIPIGDVRARTQGMTRGTSKGKPAGPTEAERLQKLKDNRAQCAWLAGFRDPSSGETADQYLKAQEAEFKRWEADRFRDAPRFPDVKGLVAAKRIPA